MGSKWGILMSQKMLKSNPRSDEYFIALRNFTILKTHTIPSGILTLLRNHAQLTSHLQNTCFSCKLIYMLKRPSWLRYVHYIVPTQVDSVSITTRLQELPRFHFSRKRRASPKSLSTRLAAETTGCFVTCCKS